MLIQPVLNPPLFFASLFRYPLSGNVDRNQREQSINIFAQYLGMIHPLTEFQLRFLKPVQKWGGGVLMGKKQSIFDPSIDTSKLFKKKHLTENCRSVILEVTFFHSTTLLRKKV